MAHPLNKLTMRIFHFSTKFQYSLIQKIQLEVAYNTTELHFYMNFTCLLSNWVATLPSNALGTIFLL